MRNFETSNCHLELCLQLLRRALARRRAAGCAGVAVFTTWRVRVRVDAGPQLWRYTTALSRARSAAPNNFVRRFASDLARPLPSESALASLERRVAFSKRRGTPGLSTHIRPSRRFRAPLRSFFYIPAAVRENCLRLCPATPGQRWAL